jgi:hypothetical protein
MTKTEIQSNIEKLQKGIDSSATPKDFLPKLKEKKEQLEKSLKELEEAEKDLAKAEEDIKKVVKQDEGSVKKEKSEIEADIKKLEKGIDSPATPKQFIAKLKEQKVKLEKTLETLSEPKQDVKKVEKKIEVAKAQRVQTKKIVKTHKEQESKKIVSSVKSLLASLSKEQKSFNKGRTHDELERDAQRKAKKPGKRISAEGNKYTENRANRSDISKKKYPYLEKGGKIYQNPPENDTYTKFEDVLKKAKPAGWRYTLAGAKRLKISNPNSKPSKANIEKYKGKHFTDSRRIKHRYVYIERRADKSDKKRSFPYLEEGGDIETGLKVYVKPEKKEGNAMFKQGEGVFVEFGDDEHGFFSESDILKMQEGEIDAEIAEELLETHNINVFGYQTRHFDMCERAVVSFNEAMLKLDSMELAEGVKQSREEGLRDCATKLDNILGYEKLHSEGIIDRESMDCDAILTDLQLFAIYNYKSGMLIDASIPNPHIINIVKGQEYAHGGTIEDGNVEMLESNVHAIKHHAEELEHLFNKYIEVEAWVNAKAQRAATDLSDITHYLDGLHHEGHEKMAHGGELYKDINSYQVSTEKGGFTTSSKEELISRLERMGYKYLGDTTEEETYSSNPIYDFSWQMYAPKFEGLHFMKNSNNQIRYESWEVYDSLSMAHGGETHFKDKVSAIEKKLVGTSVKGKYSSKYGSTYNKSEAHEAAQKIAGSMVAKERIK